MVRCHPACYQHTLLEPGSEWDGGALVHMASWVTCTFVKTALMLNVIGLGGMYLFF